MEWQSPYDSGSAALWRRRSRARREVARHSRGVGRLRGSPGSPRSHSAGADRLQGILEEDPASLNRPFREYGLFPWDAEGWHTPLAYAVMRGREGIVRLLMERGADATLRSPEGKTLSEIA